MSEIKSEKAKEYISKCFHNNVVGYNRHKVMDIVSIAETEAEQRHEQQLQELKDRVERAFYYSCNACDGDGGCRLRDNRACLMRCKKAKLFIQKLTKKQ